MQKKEAVLINKTPGLYYVEMRTIFTVQAGVNSISTWYKVISVLSCYSFRPVPRGVQVWPFCVLHMLNKANQTQVLGNVTLYPAFTV